MVALLLSGDIEVIHGPFKTVGNKSMEGVSTVCALAGQEKEGDEGIASSVAKGCRGLSVLRLRSTKTDQAEPSVVFRKGPGSVRLGFKMRRVPSTIIGVFYCQP